MTRRKLFFECYQLAGALTMEDEGLWTKGQKERLQVLLLDVLSEPGRYTAKTVRELRRLAVLP